MHARQKFGHTKIQLFPCSIYPLIHPVHELADVQVEHGIWHAVHPPELAIKNPLEQTKH